MKLSPEGPPGEAPQGCSGLAGHALHTIGHAATTRPRIDTDSWYTVRSTLWALDRGSGDGGS